MKKIFFIVCCLLLTVNFCSAQILQKGKGGTAPWLGPDLGKVFISGGTLPPSWQSLPVIPPFPNDLTLFLRGDSTWQPIPGSGSTVPAYPDDTTLFLRGDSTWQTLSGGGGGAWITEIPSGVENDTNTVFTISYTSLSDTTTDFTVWKNGLTLNPFTHSGWTGSPDYTISGTTITFSIAPSSTDIILTRYRY